MIDPLFIPSFRLGLFMPDCQALMSSCGSAGVLRYSLIDTVDNHPHRPAVPIFTHHQSPCATVSNSIAWTARRRIGRHSSHRRKQHIIVTASHPKQTRVVNSFEFDPRIPSFSILIRSSGSASLTNHVELNHACLSPGVKSSVVHCI